MDHRVGFMTRIIGNALMLELRTFSDNNREMIIV